jgi:hypothetical protein
MRKLILVLLLCSSVAWGDTLILKDGSRHQGNLESTSRQYIVFQENGMTHRYSRSNVASIEFNNENAYNSNYQNNGYNANNGYNQNNGYNSGPNYANNNGRYNNGSYNNGNYGPSAVNLPEGTQISVRTDENIDSQSASEGQLYPAEVSQDVLGPNGNIVIPKGSQAELTIASINSGTGSNDLTLALNSVRVGGNTYNLSSENVQQGNAGFGKNKRTGEYVGGGAALGTIIGAIAGGGKGAVIGAIAGAGAGAGAQVLTKGDQVKVPAETVLQFQLNQPVTMRRR